MLKQDNGQDCNWASMGLEQNVQLNAPKGSKIEIGQNGAISIVRPTIAQPGQEEIVVPINQETNWYKDLSASFREKGSKENIYLLLQVFMIPLKTGPGPLSSSQYENLGYTVL